MYDAFATGNIPAVVERVFARLVDDWDGWTLDIDEYLRLAGKPVEKRASTSKGREPFSD